MTFPDQSHINRVRDALWRRSGNGASVMVGSRFSRNSVPSGPQVVALPTWQEVTSQLYSEMYPDESNASYPNQLRTAQEYEAAFGRGALHEALRRLVRHEEHTPGAAAFSVAATTLAGHLHHQLGHPLGTNPQQCFGTSIRRHQ